MINFMLNRISMSDLNKFFLEYTDPKIIRDVVPSNIDAKYFLIEIEKVYYPIQNKQLTQIIEKLKESGVFING